ncbi:cupin domain-containing protein [Acuticoccus sp. MNP-M23]|uniref:cupin domain-containing protein n=1 Tax=Acuticoccus sp. MNP-M23 TaxID=3072793 RepID=UPI002814E12E|nr:cupin domain-containing protein [Acuticoccus sp. MNP-M23]WMS41505.1 cupin domain-containing protein [Acuticoccus sp. MNP-M23]
MPPDRDLPHHAGDAPAANVESLRFAPGHHIPNNNLLPALLMRGAAGETGAKAIIALFARNGWGGAWQYTVFPFHHYHPNAHEVLAVVSGRADIELGGPEGSVVSVAAGDVMVLPAGTGHCRVAASDDFSVCGAYPAGQENYETLRGEAPVTAAARAQIAAVPLPAADPVFGKAGPLVSLWRDAAAKAR